MQLNLIKSLLIFTLGYFIGVAPHTSLFNYTPEPQVISKVDFTKDKIEAVSRFIEERSPGVPDSLRYSYAKYYVEAEKEFNVNAYLLASIGFYESNYKHTAMSNMGAIGLQQIMSLWVKEIPFLDTPADLLNARNNIRASAYIVAHYRELCGADVASIASCYHGGPGAKWHPKDSTKRYVNKVITLFNETNESTVYASNDVPSF